MTRYSGRNYPQDDERRRDRPTSMPAKERQKKPCPSEDKRSTHSDGEPLQIETLCRRSLCRRSRLKQMSASDAYR